MNAGLTSLRKLVLCGAATTCMRECVCGQQLRERCVLGEEGIVAVIAAKLEIASVDSRACDAFGGIAHFARREERI